MHSASWRRNCRSDSCEDKAAPLRAASHLKRSRCIANRMNSWWPTLGASQVSSAQPRFLLLPLGVPPPHVIDGSRGLLCPWLYRPAKTRSVFPFVPAREGLSRESQTISADKLDPLFPICSLTHKRKCSFPRPVRVSCGKTIDFAAEIATLSLPARLSGLCFAGKIKHVLLWRPPSAHKWATRIHCFLIYATLS